MSEDRDESLPSIALPPTGTGARAQLRARRRHERRVQSAWYVGAVIVLSAAIPVLGYIGFHNIVTTREGRRIDAENDPTKPNYEANVIPTPVILVSQVDEEGVKSLTMLSLDANDDGGSVLFIPVASVTDDVVEGSPLEGSTTTTTTTLPGAAPGKITLEQAYASKGDFALEQLTANVVGLSFESVVTLDANAVAQFLAPVAPLTIDNPDRLVEVGGGKTSVAFPAGEIELEAADVARYLSIRNPNESDLARLARQELVWRAWLASIKGSVNPDVIPGETASGFGRYLSGLAKGDVRFATLPAAADEDDEGNEIFVPDADQIDTLMSTVVPLRTPANPGDRLRVRLLSGVGPLDVTALLATDLVPREAQVTIVGNADRFDYADTQVVYYDDGFAADAEDLKNLLGVGVVSKRTTPSDFEDITIIIGQDLVNERGLKITTSVSSGG